MTQNVSKNVTGWTKPVLVELGSLLDVSQMIAPVSSQCSAQPNSCKS